MALGIGLPEIFVLLIVLVAVFGSKRVTEAAKDIGKASGELSKAKKEYQDVVENLDKELTQLASEPTQRTPTSKSSSKPTQTAKAKRAKKGVAQHG